MSDAKPAPEPEPDPEPISEADLRALLKAQGLAIRDDEVAPVLATARVLRRAAALLRAAA